MMMMHLITQKMNNPHGLKMFGRSQKPNQKRQKNPTMMMMVLLGQIRKPIYNPKYKR